MRIGRVVTAAILCQVGVAKNHLRGRGRRLAQEDPCLVLLKANHQGRNNNTRESTSVVCQLQRTDAAALGVEMLSLVGVNQGWVNENRVVSGVTTLYAPGAMMIGHNKLILPDADEGASMFPLRRQNQKSSQRTSSQQVPSYQLVTPEPASSETTQENNLFQKNGQASHRTMGEKEVLVVRVIATDSQTSNSSQVLRDKIFGTNGDSVNLSSQIRACSYGKLKMIPTPDSRADNGVYTLSLDRSVQRKRLDVVEELVTNRLREELGNHLGQQFDHVIYCLPNGTAGGDWLGYAYVNWWLIVLNDQWCTSPSAVLHELGHNLGFGHSGDLRNTYGDQSGLMGFSYLEDDTPRMCYNGAKGWEAGWFQDGHEIVYPLERLWIGRLVGMSEYPRATSQHKILVKLEGDNNYEYYIHFNRKSGMNGGTREGGNKVLVARRDKQVPTDRRSTLVAILGSGETYTTSFGGRTLTVRVPSINLYFSPFYAQVNVYTG